MILGSRVTENPVLVREDWGVVRETAEGAMLVNTILRETVSPDTTQPKSSRYSGKVGLNIKETHNILLLKVNDLLAIIKRK